MAVKIGPDSHPAKPLAETLRVAQDTTEADDMSLLRSAAAGNGKAPSMGLQNVGEGDYVGVPTDRRR